MGLLHGAVHRTETLTGELRAWRHNARSQRAFEIATETATMGGVAMVHGVARFDDVQESETVWRVVQGPGGRYHWQEISLSGSGVGLPGGTQGCDGKRSWSIEPDGVRLGRPRSCALTERLLDPSWVLTHDLEVTGETLAGDRPALQVKAVARPSRPRGGGAADMAAERDLIVDAERGFLHRDSALVEGQPYDIMEMRNVVLDPELDSAVFDPEIPAGAKVFDYSRERPVAPWNRVRRWHLRWPISRW